MQGIKRKVDQGKGACMSPSHVAKYQQAVAAIGGTKTKCRAIVNISELFKEIM